MRSISEKSVLELFAVRMTLELNADSREFSDLDFLDFEQSFGSFPTFRYINMGNHSPYKGA